jgi:hypothetical protein
MLPEDGRHSLGCFRPALTPATPHFPEDDDEEAIHSNSMSPARRLVVVFKPSIRIASCRPRVVRSGEESEKETICEMPCASPPPPYTTEDGIQERPVSKARLLHGNSSIFDDLPSLSVPSSSPISQTVTRILFTHARELPPPNLFKASPLDARAFRRRRNIEFRSHRRGSPISSSPTPR